MPLAIKIFLLHGGAGDIIHYDYTTTHITYETVCTIYMYTNLVLCTKMLNYLETCTSCEKSEQAKHNVNSIVRSDENIIY